MCCWSRLTKEDGTVHPGLRYVGSCSVRRIPVPAGAAQPPIAQSALACHGHDSDHTLTPGIPSNPRMQLTTAMATVRHLSGQLDRGAHTILSDDLRALPPTPEEHTERNGCLTDALPPVHHTIFPQLLVTPNWPPVMLVHGSEDSVVPADSSRAMYAHLCAAGVETVLRIAEGSEHAFDLKGGAEETFGELFDDAVEFLHDALVYA
jgi:acetyl esterase/lipase